MGHQIQPLTHASFLKSQKFLGRKQWEKRLLLPCARAGAEGVAGPKTVRLSPRPAPGSSRPQPRSCLSPNASPFTPTAHGPWLSGRAHAGQRLSQGRGGRSVPQGAGGW